MFRDVNRIIFDLDNTIIAHEPIRESDAMAKYLEIKDIVTFKKQLAVMFEENAKYIKNKVITEELFAEIIEHLMPMLRYEGKTGMDLLEAIYNTMPGYLMEGTKEILEYLHDKGYKIVALTNWFFRQQIGMLKLQGILDHFEKIYAWDGYYAKPSPHAIKRAIDNTEPSTNVIIGDDLIGDITVPKSYGLKTIGFNIDYSKYSIKRVKKPDIDITNLSELKKYL